MSDLGDLRVEFQVRTLAQHIWAVVSHKLQYKQEESVPKQLVRSLNRASALLETVDLEFERVLAERKVYIEVDLPKVRDDEPLNVDLIESILKEFFPLQNLNPDGEFYETLLQDFAILSIATVSDLRNLLSTHSRNAMEVEEQLVREPTEAASHIFKERLARGVFLSHTGLAHRTLKIRFGDDRVSQVVQKRLGTKKA